MGERRIHVLNLQITMVGDADATTAIAPFGPCSNNGRSAQASSGLAA